jgi:hypothetical protein
VIQEKYIGRNINPCRGIRYGSCHVRCPCKRLIFNTGEMHNKSLGENKEPGMKDYKRVNTMIV